MQTPLSGAFDFAAILGPGDVVAWTQSIDEPPGLARSSRGIEPPERRPFVGMSMLLKSSSNAAAVDEIGSKSFLLHRL